MKPSDDIVARIQKLLRLANDSSASEGEIENALKFARELMTKYAIDEAQLGDKKPAVSYESPAYRVSVSVWERSLAAAIAMATDCEWALQKTAQGHAPRFYGLAASSTIACLLYELTRVSIRECSRKTLGKFDVFFARGYCAGLREVLQAAKQQAEQTNAIVLARNQIVADHMKTLTLKPLRSRSSTGFNPDSYEAGRQQGKKVNLKDPILKG